jgi:hypothetical protein
MASEHAAGATIGRYVVLERIAAGAMGVVLAAYDPKLDRKIALKLLHPGLDVGTGTSGGVARLIREARALAKLSHPNVVTVHDADVVGDQVFIAMEFVDGSNLAAWWRQRERSWPEIVDVLAHAGRGLAAAHAAGLIHRDFKPENVLVGVDGRVRVVDFGIARAPGLLSRGDGGRSAPPSEPEQRPEDGAAILRTTERGDGAATDDAWARASARLTRTGALLGTPAYMAPEQHLGLAIDARTDQFSFCMTLYEALYGVLAFEGSSVAALAMNVTHGRLREPPARSSVPPWLRRAVLRGLSTDPEERWPSMDALLAELAREPKRRLVRRVGVAAFAGVAVLAVAWPTSSRSAACAGAERHLDGVWDDDTRQVVDQAFVATELPFAHAATATTATALDAYTTEWVEAHRAACEATHVHGEQSMDLLDRRMACLDGRLRRVAALTRVLARADAEVVGRAADAVGALPGLEPCRDVDALLRADVPLSGDARRTADEADAVLAEAEALRAAGKFDAARVAVASAV